MLVSILAPLIFAAAPSGQMTLVEIGDGIPTNWQSVLQKEAEKTISKVAKAVPPPKADLANLQLLLGCNSLDAACIGEILSSSSAKTALHIRVVSREGGAALSYAVIDRSGRARRATNNYFMSRDDDGLKIAKEILSFVNDINPPTHVVVTTEDVDVFIDGKPVGRGPLSLVGKVIPGAHEIEVRRQGYDPLKQQQNVARGGTETKGFKMRKSPVPVDSGEGEGESEGEGEEEDGAKAKKMGEPLSLKSAGWPLIAVGTIVAAVGGGVLTSSQYFSGRSCFEPTEWSIGRCFEGTDETDPHPGRANNRINEFYSTDGFEVTFDETAFSDRCAVDDVFDDTQCGNLKRQIEDTKAAAEQRLLYTSLLVAGGAIAAVGAGILILSGDPTEASTSEIAQAPKLHPTVVWLDKKPQAQTHSKRP